MLAGHAVALTGAERYRSFSVGRSRETLPPDKGNCTHGLDLLSEPVYPSILFPIGPRVPSGTGTTSCDARREAQNDDLCVCRRKLAHGANLLTSYFVDYRELFASPLDSHLGKQVSDSGPLSFGDCLALHHMCGWAVLVEAE